ncbi:hypothetical protein CHRYSEOSP005_11650 [Chryseobacterium sp. Alg-005]|uniref:hypothetical protein n=1 Tax=Chryseobacterium sp. Alg-005 TaxID=3159516 RepID=UPI003555A6ED
MNKKLILLLLFISFFSFAQRAKFSEYFNSYKDKSYSLFIDYKKDKYTVWVGLPSNDLISDFTYVQFTNKDNVEFLNAFKLAQNKFNEWKKVNDKEKLNSVVKDMDIESKKFHYSFVLGDNLYNTNSDKLKFKFIVENDIPYCVFYAKGLASSTNSYIRMNGFELRFSNDEDFSNFFEKLKKESILSFIEKDEHKKKLLQ